MHPWIMKQMAIERQNDYLKEAEVYRIACQVEKGRSVQASLLNRMAAHLGGLLIWPLRQLANQDTVSPAEKTTDAYREIAAG